MTQFFLNVVDGSATLADHEGIDLIDVGDVAREALRDARKILAEGDASGLCRRHWAIEVTNETGSVVYSLPFSHALQPDRLRRDVAGEARRL